MEYICCCGNFMCVSFERYVFTWSGLSVYCRYLPTIFDFFKMASKIFKDVSVRSTRPEYIDAGWMTRLREWFSL